MSSVKKRPIDKSSKGEKFLTLSLDIIIILMVILVALEYSLVLKTNPEYLVANENSDLEGKPVACTYNEFQKVDGCFRETGFIYPNEMYIKYTNPNLYWMINNQGWIIEIIFIYLLWSRRRLIKLTWNKIKN